jgi:single-stranded DNA-binding protein
MDIRILDGRLTRDAEVKTGKDGQKFLSFTIANNKLLKGERVTTFFNVISYNDFFIKRQETDTAFKKGRLLIVSGNPSETMSVKDGKTYLNRNIIANNIEYGYDGSSENKEHQTETYHSVAPATPTVEVPKPNIPTLQDVAPKPVSKPDIKEPVKAPTTSFTTNIEDELPF